MIFSLAFRVLKSVFIVSNSNLKGGRLDTGSGSGGKINGNFANSGSMGEVNGESVGSGGNDKTSLVKRAE